jgi:hypothetical protein
LYVGTQCGTKRGWSSAGRDCFNDLMIAVYLDRKNNGEKFDDFMLKRMCALFGGSRKRARTSTDESPPSQSVITYSDLNIAFMVEQANLAAVRAPDNQTTPVRTPARNLG